MKRRFKAEKKEKEKLEKELAKQQTQDQNEKKVIHEESEDPNEYFKLRTQMVNQLKEAGQHPYPHKYLVTMSLTDFIQKYSFKIDILSIFIVFPYGSLG